jgi:pimeloyl-ACP methyl ester carboxylesterase
MQRITKFLVLVTILFAIILVFIPVNTPSLFESEELIQSLDDGDLIIIFNPGGWGDTPMKEAQDFLPIVEGMADTLDQWGHNVVVIPYNRANEGILNKISATKDFFAGYSFSSDTFAKDLDSIIEKFPDKKIILAGLSNGAAFINETYGKVSEGLNDSLYAISVGSPFWSEKAEGKNVLQIDNNGKDTLSGGKIGSLLLATIKAPFKWFFSKTAGESVSLSKAFQAEGHSYSWSSPETRDSILMFLENNIR